MSFYEQLKDKLEHVHQWPTNYQFKFIIPSEHRPLLLSKLPLGQISERQSKEGRYTSVSIKCCMQKAESVIEIYQKVQEIPGIISL